MSSSAGRKSERHLKVMKLLSWEAPQERDQDQQRVLCCSGLSSVKMTQNVTPGYVKAIWKKGDDGPSQ